ncbi:MAG: hypothetical protein J7L07_09905 [Candidatus Odinarchaeota archaeon]|nr:hypothetical protein [Candidatus Odinarchaeota archaeon]
MSSPKKKEKEAKEILDELLSVSKTILNNIVKDNTMKASRKNAEKGNKRISIILFSLKNYFV